MHLEDTKYIWVVEDEYGDIQTEFFYPESEENERLMEEVKQLQQLINGNRY